MKIISGKTWKKIVELVNKLTTNTLTCETGWMWRIDEALFMLRYNQNHKNFIDHCLSSRKNKCKHKKHIKLSFYGSAWHIFCMTCGESRLCAVGEGAPSTSQPKAYLDNLAKKVEYV